MTMVATGISIVFATSSFSAEMLDVGIGGISRESFDFGHHGTTGGRPFKPGKTYDPGELTLDILYDPNSQPPIEGAPEVITITFPVPEGDSSGAEHEITGFVTNFDIQGPFEDRLTASITIKLSGDWTFTDSA